ncbi:MAG TPA: urea ABC transporter permease subunit UrtB [Candidatus Acidoferrum sp.]|nr:urea ABC transporter permease subunit UrtB [Candidatus Acidoferrum sp.]
MPGRHTSARTGIALAVLALLGAAGQGPGAAFAGAASGGEPGAASAAPPELATIAGGLAQEDSAAVAAAVAALGERSEPAALDLLLALQERRLRVGVDRRVAIAVSAASGADTLRDPLSGAPIALPGPLRTPVVDNAVRRALAPAIARGRLRSQRLAERRAAAAVIARSPPPADLVPFLRERLLVDTDAAVRSRLGLALAHVDLDSPDPERRLAAIRAIAEAGDLGFAPRLAGFAARTEGGAYREPDPRVRGAAADTLSTLQRQRRVTGLIRDLTYGLSQGSLLLLVAIGLAITFGLMGVINMAHGEMLMLGAYTTFVVQTQFQRHWPGAWSFYLFAAIPAAFLVCMTVGMLLERTVIRHLYGRTLETLLATWGISLLLIQSVRVVFGAQNVTVPNPTWLSGGWELAAGVVLPYTRIATIGFAAAVVVFIALVLRRTRIGLEVRAIMQNRAMARNLGVRAPRVDMLTFGLGSAIAGLGGVALSQIGNVGPEMGQLYIVDSFMVVVVGGVGKLIGTVLAALGLGLINKLLEPLAGAVLGKIAVLAAVIVFIQRRPQGLFAPRGRSSEA